jgi:hypothetical protein
MGVFDPFDLANFDLAAPLVRPAVEVCRLFNGAIDEIFYDVPGLVSALAERDRAVADMQGSVGPSRMIDLDALRDPEGCLLLIDPAVEPYIHRFATVNAFLESPLENARHVEIVTITGVGSSALGSAAFAWQIAAAKAKPVLAIVPGYGVADMVEQALGGWFGFGLHDWLKSKDTIQTSLAEAAPETARIGRQLSATAPGANKAGDGAPVFRFGSGSSDVLHALIEHRAAPFRMAVGHSKGALQIGNAIHSLPAAKTEELTVVTLGCPIAEDVTNVTYRQYLGALDTLGQLNAWGHWPEHWQWSWHTTNPWLAPAMDVAEAVR